MHPRYGLAKEYHVLTLSRPTDATLQRVRDGVVIDGKRVVPTSPAAARRPRWADADDHPAVRGSRVVRRMMDAVGIPSNGCVG
jgi:16S rRNA U516 pseudouridylate synthase RsuA-like enzyme